jgi:hypothetical protein
MGASSLNAEVKALVRLQMVRGRNSSYRRFKIEIMHGAGEMLGNLQLALDECLVDDHFGGDVSQFTFLPGFHLFSHRLEVWETIFEPMVRNFADSLQRTQAEAAVALL